MRKFRPVFQPCFVIAGSGIFPNPIFECSLFRSRNTTEEGEKERKTETKREEGRDRDRDRECVNYVDINLLHKFYFQTLWAK
jgi:hypothetical protein